MSIGLWGVIRMWPDATVYILGGGPSLKNMDLTPLHDKRVIGVNNAYQLGQWVDVCWFGDAGWYDLHRTRLAEFGGLKVHCCTTKSYVAGGKKLGRGKPEGIEKRLDSISWNHNSGASAINLAVHFGAKRVVLLGFDMKFGENRQNNWHNDHKNPTNNKWNPYPIFLKTFPMIKKDADAIGVEILNATPDSALTIFPMVKLEETL